MSWLSFFEWFCLACIVLSVVCIVIGYPAIGGMGVVTFAALGWGDHRLNRPDDGGGDPAGVREPVGAGPSSGSAAEAATPPPDDA